MSDRRCQADAGLVPGASIEGADEIARQTPSTDSVIFPEHRLAHEPLDGLTGLEIGAACYNPFGLNTRNVATQREQSSTPRSRTRWGRSGPRRHLGLGDRIPVPDRSEDFVLWSHVLEHLPNLIGAFLEWDRIVSDGGHVFMIVPLKGALPQDA